MRQATVTKRSNRKNSSFVNLLRDLKSDISTKLENKDDLDELALYIIQVEIFYLIQKHNILKLEYVFDNLFTKHKKKDPLALFWDIINDIKRQKNGNRFVIISNKKIKFDFGIFLPIFKKFFQNCENKSVLIDGFTIGLTFEFFIANKKKSKTGSFYTPLNLVKAISKKTIDLHLYYSMDHESFLYNKLEEVSLDKLKTITDPEKKNKLHTIIKSMTILDPSMGVGNFLVESFDYILHLYEFFNIDGKNDPLSILKNQLFGIDINETSLRIYTVRLFLLLIDKEFNIDNIDDTYVLANSICANSLVELPPISHSLPFKKQIKENKFSIILSNPPYGAKLENKFKKQAKKHFATVHGIEIMDPFLQKKKLSKGNPNSAVLFTEICGNLLPELGFCAIILPKSILYIEAWESLRVYLSEKDLNVVSIIDLQKGFEGVLLEQIICIFNKQDMRNKPKISRNSLDVAIEGFITNVGLTTVSKGAYFNFNKIVINTNEQFKMIFSEIEPWNNFQLKSHRGLVVSKYLEKEKTSTNTTIIRGRDIQPLYIRSLSYCPKDRISDQLYFQYGTLMIQRIIAHVTKPKPHIILTVALNPGIPTVDTIVNIYTDKGPQFSKALAMYLHSEFINWYTYHFIYCEAIRSMDMFGYYLNQVPIRYIDTYQQLLIPYFEILTFLKTLQNDKGGKSFQLKSKIDFIERLANALIYYIYLRNLKKIEPETKNHFEKIAIQDFEIEIYFNFDEWYKNVQFREIDGWKINIHEIINQLEKIEKTRKLRNLLDYIEEIHLVKIIKEEFR